MGSKKKKLKSKSDFGYINVCFELIIEESSFHIKIGDDIC